MSLTKNNSKMDSLNVSNEIQGNNVDECHIVTLSDKLTDSKIKLLCDNIIKISYNDNINGIILSFVNVNVVDHHFIKLLVNTTKTIQLFGVVVVWVGLKPGIVATIMDFQVEIDNINFALDVDEGINTVHQILTHGLGE